MFALSKKTVVPTFFLLVFFFVSFSILSTDVQSAVDDIQTISPGGSTTVEPVTTFDSSNSNTFDDIMGDYGVSFNTPNGIPSGSQLVKGAYEDGGDMLLINGNPQTTINLADMVGKTIEIGANGEVKIDGIKVNGAVNLGGSQTPEPSSPPPTQPTNQEFSTTLDIPQTAPELFAESISSITLRDGSQILDAKNVRIYGDLFTAESVSTYVKGTSILSDITQLRSKTQIFSVGHADSVVISGTTFSDVSNSTFEITDEGMRIDSRSDAPFKITDSSYVTSTFKGNGTLIIETPSHAKNLNKSFAINELARWIEETITAIPQDSLVMANGTAISVQEATKTRIPLYFHEAASLITTYPIQGGVLLSYDEATDTFIPPVPLSLMSTPILKGISTPAKNAARMGGLLYYNPVTHLISSEYTENGVELSYEPSIDKIVPVYMASSLPVTTTSFPHTIAQQLVNEVITIVEQTASDITIYTVTDGALTFENEMGLDGISETYNETIDATNSTSVIVIDSAFGIACTQLMPKSGYHYVDPVIEKDFSLFVPMDGAPYALCLKKSVVQELTNFEGIVDFTKKEMNLKNIINYKRYPLKNNKIADTLTSEVYEGKSQAQSELRYQPNFILLDSVMIHGVTSQTKPLITRTKPSNYYSITQEILGGQKKRLAWVNWKLSGTKYTQSIPQLYTADDGLPKLTLVHNVLIQDNGQTRTTILPPEHEQIATLLE